MNEQTQLHLGVTGVQVNIYAEDGGSGWAVVLRLCSLEAGWARVDGYSHLTWEEALDVAFQALVKAHAVRR